MRKADAYRRVGKICLALPEAVNKPFGGHTTPCYRVGDKIFCGTRQAKRPGLNLKAPPGVQQALVASDPERFFVPPYSGPKGWVGVWLDVEQDWDEVAELIEESYRLIAPRRLVAQLDALQKAELSRRNDARARQNRGRGSPETRASAKPRPAPSTRPARRSR